MRLSKRYRKPYRIVWLPRIAGQAEHADFIRRNLLFGKQLHTIHMPDIANEQEQTHEGYAKWWLQCHSETEDERISAIGEHTVKAGCIRHHLHRCRQNLPNGRDAKNLQDINPRKARLQAAINVAWNGDALKLHRAQFNITGKYINCYISYFDLTVNIFTFVPRQRPHHPNHGQSGNHGTGQTI